MIDSENSEYSLDTLLEQIEDQLVKLDPAVFQIFPPGWDREGNQVTLSFTQHPADLAGHGLFRSDDPGRVLLSSKLVRSTRLSGSLLHELFHWVHHRFRAHEDDWIKEGLALQFGPRFRFEGVSPAPYVAAALARPDVSLSHPYNPRNLDAAWYGKAFLTLDYLLDRCGGRDAFWRLAGAPNTRDANGDTRGFERLRALVPELARDHPEGDCPPTLEDWMERVAVAFAVNDGSAKPRERYRISPGTARAATSHAARALAPWDFQILALPAESAERDAFLRSAIRAWTSAGCEGDVAPLGLKVYWIQHSRPSLPPVAKLLARPCSDAPEDSIAHVFTAEADGARPSRILGFRAGRP